MNLCVISSDPKPLSSLKNHQLPQLFTSILQVSALSNRFAQTIPKPLAPIFKRPNFWTFFAVSPNTSFCSSTPTFEFSPRYLSRVPNKFHHSKQRKCSVIYGSPLDPLSPPEGLTLPTPAVILACSNALH